MILALAYIYGLLRVNKGLVYGTATSHFGLLGFPERAANMMMLRA